MWPPSWAKKRYASASASTALSTAASPPVPSSSSPLSLKDLQALLLPDSISTSTARIFHRVRASASALRVLRNLQALPAATVQDRRVVLYFTSLHVVRSTYEDCRMVHAILHGLRAVIDERDLSMDRCFLPELATLLPQRGVVTIPQVFIGDHHLGGADEILRLHESGELGGILAGASTTSAADCGRCVGECYVVYDNCSGSHKRYSRKCGGFLSCADCNQNRLVRCPDCYMPAV